MSDDSGESVPTIKEGSKPQAARELLGSKPPMDAITGVGSDSCPSNCGAFSCRAEACADLVWCAASGESPGSARYAIWWPQTGAKVARGCDVMDTAEGILSFAVCARISGVAFSTFREWLVTPV